MAVRSLNRVQLIGNLTRDPELRYTPQGTAVCTFGLATNRSWTTDTGEKREEVEFHRIVCWNKLAEVCSQLCTKGRKIYVEGRLATRSWTGQDGQKRTTTEIVIDDMILLDSRRPETVSSSVEEPIIQTEEAAEASEETPEEPSTKEVKTARLAARQAKKKKEVSDLPEEKTLQQSSGQAEEEINPDDIPF